MRKNTAIRIDQSKNQGSTISALAPLSREVGEVDEE